jgi:hypothetical protein
MQFVSFSSAVLLITMAIPCSTLLAQIDAELDDPSSGPNRFPHLGQVSITPFNAGGVTVVPSTSPQFGTLLSSVASSPVVATIQPLLPFSVLIKNDGPKAVLGYTVVWAAVNPDRTPYTDFRGMIDYVMLKRLVPPGQLSLATIFGPLDSLFIDQDFSTVMSNQLQTFQSRASLTISIDAVLFDDGTVAGGDIFKTIADMRARIRSEYDLFTAVAAKAAGGVSASDLLSWLQTLSDSMPRGRSKVDLRTDAFSAWYQYYEARLAGTLIKGANNKSVAEMVNYVRTTLLNKAYPQELVK